MKELLSIISVFIILNYKYCIINYKDFVIKITLLGVKFCNGGGIAVSLVINAVPVL